MSDLPDLSDAPWRDIPWRLLGDARGVPTMLSPQERRAYLWLAEHWARGAGCVVDLGCFAGGSTAHLAEGQRRDGRSGRIHAYDRFTISDPLKEKFLYPAGIAPYEGDDLLDAARQILAPWAGLVDLHPGAIEDQTWTGEAIEMLVMDASKAAHTMDAMAATFFPALIPGGSLIVQQDFLHWKTPWVAVQMARMADWVSPAGHAERDTMIFHVDRPLDAAAIDAGRCADLTDAEMRAALLDMRARLDGFGVEDRMDALVRAVELNAGERIAWKMKTAP
ncbi:class I SAM-dependent methyltransferase [Anianabacter salinae]|uniref:class I SAM-dependent methyltransferase n=1 Tax=Anianabacter salinae TaxID=2851023 RepID=UPI00225E349D|nr:class I SAM-dependent methyltransferase [Anianabacter salinae]MBV0913172.1 hypothetical protein [Anianabacter salinae]